MKNKLIDLNDHLFAQLERLNEEGLTKNSNKETLAREIDRSKALTSVSSQIVANGKLALEAAIFQSGGNSLPIGGKMPAMLEDKKDD